MKQKLSSKQEGVLIDIVNERIAEDKKREDNKEVSDGKEIAWYSALVEAHINTTIEKDRQLLTISALAVGVLVSFMKEITGCWSFWLWFLSGGCFIVVIVCVLIVFSKNAQYLTALVKDTKDEKVRLAFILGALDKIIFIAFLLGIVFLFVLALLGLINSRECFM